MSTRMRIITLIMALSMLLAVVACGLGATSTVPVGDFECAILMVLPDGANNIVILNFTITPEKKIGDWTIFDFGTRSVSMGDAIGEASLTGNAVQFALTSPSGLKVSYKINGTIESAHKMTGDYSFDYGSNYGVVADKFECDLTPPTAQPTSAP
jgi:hypothetical protein